jgi:hypothetical protein
MEVGKEGRGRGNVWRRRVVRESEYMSREHEIAKRAKEIFQLVGEYPEWRTRYLARYLVTKFLMDEEMTEMELVEGLKTLEEG